MTHWIIREWMNALAFPIFLCLSYRFLWVRIETPKGLPRRDAATALFVLCAGEALRGGWAWFALASQNKKWAIGPVVQNAWGIGVASIVLTIIGATCCLRVFKRSGNIGGSMSALIAAAIFLAISILL